MENILFGWSLFRMALLTLADLSEFQFCLKIYAPHFDYKPICSRIQSILSFPFVIPEKRVAGTEFYLAGKVKQAPISCSFCGQAGLPIAIIPFLCKRRCNLPMISQPVTDTRAPLPFSSCIVYKFLLEVFDFVICYQMHLQLMYI